MGRELLQASHDHVLQTTTLLQSAASWATSLAVALESSSGTANSNNTFPFVTLPDWEIHSADTRVQAEAVYLMYAPLVREGPERTAWETYAMQARFHVMQSFGESIEEGSNTSELSRL